MLRFIARRTLASLLVLWAISIMVFLIFFATPGIDPALRIAGHGATPAVLATVRREYGLDRPLPVRYALLMYHVLIRRDVTSYVNPGVKVVPEIASAIPVTFSLVLGAAVIWMLAGLAMGLVAGAKRGSAIDPLLTAVGVLGVSLPVYWLGEVINLITQSRLHHSLFAWVPPPGYVPLTHNPAEWALHLLFPWLTLAVLYAGIYSRVFRAELVTALSEDYVRTARAKGISERRVLLRHAARCSLIPVVSLFGLDFGALLGGGALVVEVVFGLPGIGLLTYNSLQSLDLATIMATVLYAAFLVVLANAVVDVIYAALDPRVRNA